MRNTFNPQRMHIAILGKMEKTHVTADQLCEQLDIQPQDISRLGHGDADIDLDAFMTLIDWLQVPAFVFMDGPSLPGRDQQLTDLIADLDESLNCMPAGPKRSVMLAARDTYALELERITLSPLAEHKLPWRSRLTV